eukprot:TRINITY_DN14842_c0_g1_i1.p1 TRINITY_DN14842_c0_g1~~TRINITY_DN14842_c0_g1_i1.p1  ORF type:complete len:133 (-),score=28.10 TRINITY_DN14842_c0_g1_i1:224-622(-)
MDVLCPETCEGAATRILATRNATILSQEESWCGRLRLLAEVPAVQALGLTEELQSISPDPRAVRQLAFCRWQALPGAATAEPGYQMSLVLALRSWKQLETTLPSPADLVGPRHGIAPDDIFADNLQDIAVGD